MLCRWRRGEIHTLRQVESLLNERFASPKGMVEGAPTAAVEQHLHEEAYQEAELECLLGVWRDDLFAGNSSQLRWVGCARYNGKHGAPENNCAWIEGKSITPASISSRKTCGLLQLQQAVLLSTPPCDGSQLHEGCISVIFIVSLHDIEGSGLLQAASSCGSGRCTCLRSRCGLPQFCDACKQEGPKDQKLARLGQLTANKKQNQELCNEAALE